MQLIAMQTFQLKIEVSFFKENVNSFVEYLNTPVPMFSDKKLHSVG